MTNKKNLANLQKLDTKKTISQYSVSTNKISKKSLLKRKKFIIVGIGASAGGLEALSELLDNLPPDTGMAFIIVQHLDPTHESKIDEILSRRTLMLVSEIKNNVYVQPNQVYIIPPNANLKVLRGKFKLMPREKNKGVPLPIDSFFKSLAKEQDSNCIGIILSGTASDGTHGLEEIKKVGGLTIAQEPRSAKYDGMPCSAIASGAVDLVLSPKQIGVELVRIARHPFTSREKLGHLSSIHVSPKNDAEETFAKILLLLQKKCHVDFSQYKRRTLNRRLSRRMLLHKKKNIKEYLAYLETNADEIDCLFNDILINVTEFFRDPNAYAALKSKIFPQIIKNKAENLPIRIWVVGCATGEEAYSIAISLMEYIGESNSKLGQIFATDISEPALQKARAGVYQNSIRKNISKERLQKFFVKTETGGYRIKNCLREMCLFSRHDVTNDPPFAKLDLICCRNLLIYFNQSLQEHVLPVLHYALKPGGFLWLGSSDSIGKMSSLFNIVDKKNSFYSSKYSSSRPTLHFPANTYMPEKLLIAKKLSDPTYFSADIGREADRIAALKYAPPGVVINLAMEIILIRGDVTPFFRLTSGQASLNLFKLAKPELVSDLRITFGIAKKKNIPIRKDGFVLYEGKEIKTFGIDIVPFTLNMASQLKERYFLISFDLVGRTLIGDQSSVTMSKRSKQRAQSKDRHIEELDKELSDSKAYQELLIQDFENTQEQLTSSNEELQSTIEELQSTNEELETAKEELQSTNEELTTVNDELQSRNVDLVKLNDDLNNFLGSVNIPIVMLGMDGTIRRFTPQASKILNLINSDIGRPISDINNNFDSLDLESLVSEVVETIALKEMNIKDRKGHWFRLQVRPYKTIENKIDGAVISLVDINVLKQNLTTSEASLAYATSVANTVHLPLVVLDRQLRLQSANQAFYEKFCIPAKKIKGDLLTLIGVNKTVDADVRKTLTVAFVSDLALKNLEVESKSLKSKSRFLLLNGKRIKWLGEEPNALLLSIEDITDRLQMEKSLKEAIVKCEKADQAKNMFLATLSHELRTPLTAILCWAQLLLTREEGSAKLKHGLEAIEQNSKIQGQLIDDLLDVSRIQTGKLNLTISHLDVGEVVRAAVESVHQLAENKSIIIKTHIKPLNGSVAADPARLQQIMWNLLNNAIKFSPPQKVIDVRIKSVLEHGQQYAAIAIIDHGKGIEPDFLPQLFERFMQEDSTSTRLHGGLGLGLTIAHDLLKLLGGSIRAKSGGEGEGATFTVLLPLILKKTKLGMKTALKETAVKRKADHLRQQGLQGLNILIVEDEQSSLDIFTELLKSAGAKTISVTNVHDAMIALDKYKPDILISDIAIPGEDGISLIQRIRARKTEQEGQIPALALTAYATQEDIDQALSAGFNAHLAKPFNAVDLIICVQNLARCKVIQRKK